MYVRKFALLGATLIAGATMAACSSNSSTTTTTTSPTTTTGATNTGIKLTTATIKTMQGALATVGCYTGPVDGLFGPGTSAALRSFQTASGITADAVYGSVSAAKLTSSAASGTKVCVVTTPTTTTTAAGTAAPPCTQAALQAALPSGATIVTTPARGAGQPNYLCSGNYAFAVVNTGPASGAGDNLTGYDYAQLFAAQNSAWAVVDRGTYCSMVPKEIYDAGCTVS